ncbi:alpha-beta hydrolase superfamily lysophospholipase [Actimicrobium sp. GrIS 1.19]|uniref:alpha/beta hydrolase n=1 Tax=Actimicrobium sp. GrIS 1.19 TaxID=3071708 RepID=UPI002E0AA4D7|nr:alpha-beta hydrolase superfamily lysophospholipase [Actimicrobium sp. GrIS 1.19]
MIVVPHESSVRAHDGTGLFVRDWLVPADQLTRGGVVMMHGLGEHCGRYGRIAQWFNQNGWSVRAYDHRGHGRSDGRRGDVPEPGSLMRDAEVVIKDFAVAQSARWDSAPILFGHSMGGLFAAQLACANLLPLRGLILSSPALALTISPMQSLLLRLMRAIAPGVGVSNGLPEGFLSHDTATVIAYRNDPLIHSKISARLLTAMLAAVDYSQLRAAEIRCPTLLLVAGDDRLVDARGSTAFFDQLDPAEATMHLFPAMYHEIFNEVDREKVYGNLGQWMSRFS